MSALAPAATSPSPTTATRLAETMLEIIGSQGNVSPEDLRQRGWTPGVVARHRDEAETIVRRRRVRRT